MERWSIGGERDGTELNDDPGKAYQFYPDMRHLSGAVNRPVPEFQLHGIDMNEGKQLKIERFCCAASRKPAAHG